MNDLTDHLTIAEARRLLQAKEITALEIVDSYCAKIDKAKLLNSYCATSFDLAKTGAASAHERIMSGDQSDLLGIPIGVKDMYCTVGAPTTASSKILAGFNSGYESFVTERLWQQGAVMLGKTSCDEFAMGSSNETSHYGPAINPWRSKMSSTALSPGGSSGGSAVSVAAGLSAASLGTDTGGSIRQPAALTGLVGMKPSYGRCSRWGIVAFASSFDQAGPFTTTVRDSAIMLRAMAGHDKRDSTSLDVDEVDFEAYVGQSIKGMRIGIPKEYSMPGMPEEISNYWQKGRNWLKDAGAEVVDVSLPHTKYALPCYYVLTPAEASSNLARYDGVRYGQRSQDGTSLEDVYYKSRTEGFGAEVKRRIMIGNYVLSAGYYDAYYIKALKIRTLIRQDFEQAFKSCDLLLTPSTPGPAFPIGDELSDPTQMYLNDVFTVTVNLAGLPAMSVPCGLNNDGLPLGLQLIAPYMRDEQLFRAGSVLEQCAEFDHSIDRWWEN